MFWEDIFYYVVFELDVVFVELSCGVVMEVYVEGGENFFCFDYGYLDQVLDVCEFVVDVVFDEVVEFFVEFYFCRFVFDDYVVEELFFFFQDFVWDFVECEVEY